MSATNPIVDKEDPGPDIQPAATGNEYDLDQDAIKKLLEFFQLLDRWDRENQQKDDGQKSGENRLTC